MVPSTPAEQSKESGSSGTTSAEGQLKLNEETALPSPTMRGHLREPVATSQNSIVPSAPPVASTVPSAVIASAVASDLAGKTLAARAAARSHKTRLPAPESAAYRTLGCVRTQVTSGQFAMPLALAALSGLSTRSGKLRSTLHNKPWPLSPPVTK